MSDSTFDDESRSIFASSCSEGIHQGPWLACDLPGAHCVVAQVSGSRGAKKMARDLQESVVLSGKRTRTATVTFVAESVGLIKQEHRRIVLPRSRFNDTWLQQHLSTTLTPAAPAVPDEQSNNADIARVTGEMRAKFPCRLAVQGDRSQGHLKMA